MTSKLFDWLAGSSKPDALGYRSVDPDRWREMRQTIEAADKAQKRRRKARARKTTEGRTNG